MGSLLARTDSPEEAAASNGLRYVYDAEPGIRRQRRGDHFRYVTASGEPVSDADRERIDGIVIPPAWTDVWICSSPKGHIQATGRDAKGRQQYRYHPDWRSARDAAKYEALVEFSRALPGIRERVAHDLSLPGVCRERVLATAIALLDLSLIRIGNDEYAETNGSYGLTTLTCEHATVNGNRITFLFNGKSGKQHSVDIRDRRIARTLKQCQELPGQHLLQYRTASGDVAHLHSDDVNAHLRCLTGSSFTAKTFRTWGASVAMARELALAGPADSATAAKRTVTAAVKAVAQQLGNTPTVCRDCYIHPAIAEHYLAGSFPHKDRNRYREAEGPGLNADERFLLRILNGAPPANGETR